MDPVTLAVIQNGLQNVCSEMDLVHERTSFSPVISEAFDRSNGIYHPENGDMIAQGELGLPIFLGVMQFTVRAALERRRDLEPGDVLIVNDPYLGGTHLMDVKMVRPFYYRGEIWCCLANTGHWPDTGGIVPGGFTSRATEIHQEGLRLPPVKLYRAGELDTDILDIILHNIRVPDERIGDIKAQAGALSVGARRLTALLDRYGRETVDAVIDELRKRSEQQMRACIEEIPNGRYEFASYMDSDGIVNEPLKVNLELTVAGSEATFDFSGSSAPARGSVNSVWATTQSAVYVAMKHVFPDVAINAGLFAPLKIPKPHDTFLYAEYPRPVAACAAEVSQRIIEVVIGALGQAIPERVPAAPAGTSGNYSLGGYDPKHRRPYIMYFFSGGGYGGWQGGDGISNGCSSIGISKTQPVEVLEQHYPILFEEYALREGSAGAGCYRGGFGVSYRTRLLRGEAVASFLMDHGVTGPHGLCGGHPGAMNEIQISQAGDVSRPEHHSKGEGYRLQCSDWVQVRTPGGGGYGDPINRDRELIVRDLERDYLTPEQAEREYGFLSTNAEGQDDPVR